MAWMNASGEMLRWLDFAVYSVASATARVIPFHNVMFLIQRRLNIQNYG
jgi:hypothetical protein